MHATSTTSRAGILALGLAVFGLLAGCDDSTGPGGAATVSLAFGLKSGSAVPAPGLFGQAPPITDGTNTITLTSAEIVLRQIEFKRVGVADCETAVNEDDCEEFETAAQLVALPIDGSVSKTVSALVPAGTYSEVEFDVHKVDPVADASFASAHPDFTDISIRVTGTFDDGTGPQPFTFESDLNEEQEIEFPANDPLVVNDGTMATAVTLMVDLDSWFRNAAGDLIDPNTANKGGVNENLVKDNIRTSIEGFRDDDSDGIPHGDDADEDNS